MFVSDVDHKPKIILIIIFIIIIIGALLPTQGKAKESSEGRRLHSFASAAEIYWVQGTGTRAKAFQLASSGSSFLNCTAASPGHEKLYSLRERT